MKSVCLSASLICASLLSGVVMADNSQSIIGTWKGVSNVAVIGDVSKHHNPADGMGVKFVKTDFTLVIEEEEGRNFSGYWMSDSHKETIAGALMSDMGSGFIVDSDGMAALKRMSADQLELCYVHVPSPANQSSVVACISYSRE